jgi:hypothetical protein
MTYDALKVIGMLALTAACRSGATRTRPSGDRLRR